MTQYQYFSHNGQVLTAKQAVIPLNNIEYSYGFGVYETIRVSNSIIYFLEQHCERLMKSAATIELEHPFDPDFVERSIRELLDRNQAETCNLKILLIGGKKPGEAELYIQCLNPLFPDRKLYAQGIHCTTEAYERPFPQAKTLNMLPSYLAYRRAKQANAYDALLINRNGNITEGTRTNFFCLNGRTVVSPPTSDILPGVTRNNVLKVALANDFQVIEQPIPLDSAASYDGAFLTSTSSKILPIRSINEATYPEVPEALRELMTAYNHFLINLK